MLEKHSDAVQAALDALDLYAEYRLDVERQSQMLLCYPPEALPALRQRFQDAEQLPYAGDHLTIRGLTKATGRHVDWVKGRLSELGIQPEPASTADPNHDSTMN